MKYTQRIWDVLLVSVLLVSTSSGAIALNNAPQAAEQKPSEVTSRKKNKELDCRKIRVTSSRIKRNICLTKQDWKRLEETSQELARRGF